MSRHPEVKWAQRLDKVFITVQLPDSKDSKVNLEPDGVFTFSGSAGSENHEYELKLELFDKVNVEESKVNIGVRSIFCILEKAEKGWWNKLLCGDGKPPHYVKVDWDKWVDEDEDDGTAGPGDMDMGDMNFSKFGGMPGMGGMGMPGMGGMGMPGMGGMGMPGMGGMGMPGMGGMGMPGMGGMGMPGMGGMGIPGMGGMDMGDMGMGDDDSDESGDDEVSKPVERESGKAEAEVVKAGGSEEKKEAVAST